MSDWDFLWGLEGDELRIAMESGGTKEDWACIEKQEKQKRKNSEKTTVKNKKENLVLLIDAESVSSNYASKIINNTDKLGQLFEARYYALQKDDSTKSWKECARQFKIKPILMCGGPSKNKIDNKIIKDARQILKQNKNIDIFCIATRDGDYTSLVSFLREHHKRVVILAPKNTSQKLKSASSKVISL